MKRRLLLILSLKRWSLEGRSLEGLLGVLIGWKKVSRDQLAYSYGSALASASVEAFVSYVSGNAYS